MFRKINVSILIPNTKPKDPTSFGSLVLKLLVRELGLGRGDLI